MIEPSRLHPDDIEAIARRVADLVLNGPQPAAPQLLTAAQVAKRFGVTRDFVYARAAELGAVRLRDGARPRMRFDAERVAAHSG